jgi:energy-coupling factor transporter ATP-binding protein EcfA2
MTSPTPMRALAKVRLALAAVAPPGLLTWVGAFQSRHSVLVTVLVVIYELILLILGMFSGAFKSLVGRWNDRLANRVDAALIRFTSRYDRAYLQYVVAANGYMDVKGLSTRGEYTLSLDDVFVQLSIEPEALHRLNADPLSRQEVTNESRSIWHWMDRARKDGTTLAIIGPPGSGKTTLLKHVCFKLATKRSGSLPVLISLRDHRAMFDVSAGPPTLAALITKSLAAVPKTMPPGWVESRLRRHRILVMLDGLDELSDQSKRQAVSTWVDGQRESYPDITFVITSRPFGYKSNPLSAATVLQVQQFTEKQVRLFLDRWYLSTAIRSHGKANDSALLAAKSGYDDLINRLEATPTLLHMAMNPLLLTMIANVHHYRGALPGSRSELYAEVCEVFLAKRHQARGIPIDMTAPQRQAVLQELAYALMLQGIRDASVADATRILKPILRRVHPDLSVPDFLRRTEESSGLLLEREAGLYGFAHLTFQEYLAACHIKENNLVDELCNQLHASWWRETALLYAAQSDATPLVLTCIKLGSQNNIGPIALAVDCVNEGREVGVDARLAMQEVVNPPNWETNPASRVVSGAVRMLQRVRSLDRVGEDSFVSRTPITHTEYQAFLDDTNWPVPDHWASEVCPSDLRELPVDGIRRSDALAFCAWSSALQSDGSQYLLPFAGEADKLLQKQENHGGIRLFWTETSVADALPASLPVPTRDDLLELHSESAILDHLRMLLPESGVAIYERLRAGSATTLQDWYKIVLSDSLDLFLDWEDLALTLADADSSELLAPYHKFAERKVPGSAAENSSVYRLSTVEDGPAELLDIEYILGEVESLAQFCFGLRDAPQPLIELAQNLQIACAIALNRSVVPESRTGDLRAVREVARLLATAAARTCDIHNVTYDGKPKKASDSKWRVLVNAVSRRVRARNKSARMFEIVTVSDSTDDRLLPQDRFWRIAVGLTALNQRISGRLPGAPGLVVVQRPRRTWLPQNPGLTRQNRHEQSLS